MKKNVIFSLLVICVMFSQANLSAQDSKEAQTLFGNGTKIGAADLGFFVAPALGITQMDGSTTALFNLRGGLSVNDKFSVGAYVNTSLNEIRPLSETLPNIYMDYWSVGGFAEYSLLSKKAFHLTLPLYVGYGEVEMDDEIGDVGFGEANFLQIEPSALLEINLHKYLRFNVGAGYRLVQEMTYRNLNQSDISGLTGYAGLKFGLFQ
jgi:hypothetical protein